MAKPAKKTDVQTEALPDIHEQDEARNLAHDAALSNKKTWLKRPEWSLEFKNGIAVINGVNDEDFELLQKDDNQGLARELVEWVNANNPTKLKVSKFQIRGGLFNIGFRGPTSPTNFFKMRPVKKTREKAVKYVQREITTHDVIQFLLSGKLDVAAFKEALDRVRRERLEQIQRLQAELASFDTFEKLAAGAPTLDRLASLQSHTGV